MTKEKKRLRFYLIALVAVVLVIVGLILWHERAKAAEDAALPAVTPRPTAEVKVRERWIEKLVEVEKEVSVEEISGGLNDMGLLVTEEYFFTDVVRFSSIKTLFNLELGITASSFLASYDGVVTAGLDFAAIEVQRDDDSGVITVTLPKSEILNTDIDPESFCLYEEKTGLGNPITLADFNSSLVELEQSARAKAIERGVLEHADENARALISNFITGLTGGATVRFQTA